MCGICCVLYENDDEENIDEILEDFEPWLRCRGPDCYQKLERGVTQSLRIKALGCTLHLRGPTPVPQPLLHSDGSFLLWNGEIYSGFQISDAENDGEVLFHRLNACEDEEQLLDTISRVLGPWAFIYFQAGSRTLWFGRDVLGRRSLLWNLPSASCKRLVLSSTASRPYLGSENGWSEVPFQGVFRVRPDLAPQLFPWSSAGLIAQNEYTVNRMSLRSPVQEPFETRVPSELELQELYGDIHTRFKNDFGAAFSSETVERGFMELSQRFEEFLLKAVERRVRNRPNHCRNCAGLKCQHPKVALLFSGGLDSSVLALLAHSCVPEDEAIDLLNVSFNRDLTSGEAEMAPDRKSGVEAWSELKNLAPHRTWNFVQVNVSKSEMELEWYGL